MTEDVPPSEPQALPLAPQSSEKAQENFPETRAVRRRFSSIWLIPIIAALIAGYLGWHDYSQHGPLITITFKTAEGLIPGQTQVKYKAVTLGTVENVRLSDDLSHVAASIRMTGAAKPFLNEHARFWVVKPELDTFKASDIETLVTGSYIQVEPGALDGASRRQFVGLENPPDDRPDEPGRIFTIKADRLGSLNVGSPVFFRDINVGRILGYDIGDGFDPIAISIFIRDPYNKYVREESRFWNASGLSLNLGPNGLHLETHWLRSVLSGGIAFMTPPEAQAEQPAPAKTLFTLYDDQASAETATHTQHIPYIAYFQTSVKDLAPGAPVLIYGIPVGEVTNVRLVFDAQSNQPKVRVSLAIQPDIAFGRDINDPADVLRKLVEKGMRIKLDTGNIITGQKDMVLEFTPNADPVQIAMEGDAIVLPAGGSGGGLMDGVGDLVNKLNSIPFEDIGNNLDHLLKSADKTVSGPDMQQAVHNLSVAMANAADLTRKANANMTPALQRLPDISAQLQEAATHANALLNGLNNGYGDGSDFQRDTRRVLDQVNDAARSVRLLSDFLERHPEALLSGKSGEVRDGKDKP